MADQKTGNGHAARVYEESRFAKFLPSQAATTSAHLCFAEFVEHVAVDTGVASPGIWAPLALAPEFFERSGFNVAPNVLSLLAPQVKALSDAQGLTVPAMDALLQQHFP